MLDAIILEEITNTTSLKTYYYCLKCIMCNVITFFLENVNRPLYKNIKNHLRIMSDDHFIENVEFQCGLATYKSTLRSS